MADLDVLPEDWERALAVVAHPDDMEYGAAAAVARWTQQGKHIAYVLVSDGEAGISTMTPAEVGPLRREEQIASCRVVGVDDVEFLGWPDGSIVEGLELRADLAAAVRRHRPEVVLSINFRDSWVDRAGTTRPPGGRPVTARRGARCSEPVGVRRSGRRVGRLPLRGLQRQSATVPRRRHDRHVRRRCCPAGRAPRVLDNLGGDMASPDEFLRGAATAAGERMGTPLARRSSSSAERSLLIDDGWTVGAEEHHVEAWKMVE